MSTTRDRVVALLEAYAEKKKKIMQLRYELDHPATVSDDEMLRSLALKSGIHEFVNRKSGSISDKTLLIATNYQKEADSKNNETISEIVKELRKLENETDKLDCYIAQLDDKKALILTRLYIEQHRVDRVADELQVSRRTVFNYRDSAIDALTEMYTYISAFRGESSV